MKRCIVFLLVISLISLIILPACGDNDEEKTPVPTSTATLTSTATPVKTATATPTATPVKTATSTPTPSGPVKIGAISSWSGATAMAGQLLDTVIALVEWQVQQKGGILGGREVKFYRGDNRGSAAEAAGMVTKLALEDKVTIITIGGSTVPEFTAVAQKADELKVPFLACAYMLGAKDLKYSAGIISSSTMTDRDIGFVTEYLKPKTAAWLGTDTESSKTALEGVKGEWVGLKDALKSAGIDFISEQLYPVETMDYSSYLTKLKYENPDVVVFSPTGKEQALNVFRQITELGGWGTIKVVGHGDTIASKDVASLPGALGQYTGTMWVSGSDDPGMKYYEDSWNEKYGEEATSVYTYYYNSIWGAIEAIKLAGTDNREEVAQAMRSGNLEWDSAWGRLRIDTDGNGVTKGAVSQIEEGGKLVKVWP